MFIAGNVLQPWRPPAPENDAHFSRLAIHQVEDHLAEFERQLPKQASNASLGLGIQH